MSTTTRTLFAIAAALRLARCPRASRRVVDLAVYLATAEELFRR